jgi:predicted restriction endonuclease
MNTINDEFDVVIKIKKLDDYRLRPQKTATTQEPIAAKNSVSSSIHSLNLGDIEKMIYAVIENTNIGIKAKDIADKLRMSRSDVNHYLYGTLKEFVKIDNDYKWHVVKSAKNSCTGSTFLKQENTNNNRKSIQLKSIDYNLLRNGDVASYIKMFDKLVVSHRNGLNAPHKYILLISVFSLIGKGEICSNKFGSTKEIEEEFNKT